MKKQDRPTKGSTKPVHLTLTLEVEVSPDFQLTYPHVSADNASLAMLAAMHTVGTGSFDAEQDNGRVVEVEGMMRVVAQLNASEV